MKITNKIVIKWQGEKWYKDFDKQVNQAEKEMARDVAKSAKRYCPVSSPKEFAKRERQAERNGWANPKHLRSTIKAYKSKFKEGGYIVHAGGRGARHAAQVELGTHKMEAKPYLRPALKDHDLYQRVWEKTRGYLD